MPATDTTPPLNSVGSIARQLHADRDDVRYVVRRAGISPIGRVGHIKVYADDAIEQVRLELRRLQAVRQERAL